MITTEEKLWGEKRINKILEAKIKELELDSQQARDGVLEISELKKRIIELELELGKKLNSEEQIIESQNQQIIDRLNAGQSQWKHKLKENKILNKEMKEFKILKRELDDRIQNSHKRGRKVK